MSALTNITTTRRPADLLEEELLQHCVCHKTSFLAASTLEEDHALAVHQNGSGFYLGCTSEWRPGFRDSEYFATQEVAQAALDNRSWAQRMDP